MAEDGGKKHFGIDASGSGGLAARLRHRARRAFGALTGLGTLIRLREEARTIDDPFELAEFGLRGLRIELRASSCDPAVALADAFPRRGSLVIVANHPTGGLDGLAGIAAIGQARRDLRVLANPELASIEGLRSIILPLDPFGRKESRRANAASLRAAIRWIEQGGALLIFPAGEVSHFIVKRWAITDGEWHTTAARIIRHTRATVSPMFFAGCNSTLFQAAGLVHPRLRTLLLPHELARRAGSTVEVRIGAALDARALAPFTTDEALTAHLRLKTYMLAGTLQSGRDEPAPRARVASVQRAAGAPVAGGGEASAARAVSAAGACAGARAEPPVPAVDAFEPVIDPVAPDVLAAEIAALPASATLVTAGDQRVICAPARLIPNVLRELGRLREVSFRAAGEGTGRSVDLDSFDDYYEHLFVWSASQREIVGAYRLGRVDEIRRRFGTAGLYTATLFEYREPFFALLGAALELGRSFVRPEYQKSFAALLLLWKGIGAYIGRHPKYARLIGPVSISDSYSPLSKELLVRYLKARSFSHFGAALVKAKSPFRIRGALRSLGLDVNTLPDLETVSSFVAGVEADRKGVPVLLRQYLKLGGRLVGFNVDAEFSDAIDCLLVIDLRQTDPRMLKKYMSEEALASFARAHRRKARGLLDDAA
ncbi:MAG TPA: GNAT family N-acyltransferase [Steroidobacteraceae bacterium]|nr:GNAT family N-acyltransferase [Steroidobacteraceae bacterium]